MNNLALLQAFGEPGIMEAMRKEFQEAFLKLWKEKERDYCAKEGKTPVMTQEFATEIMGYLAKCHTPYHIECLKQMVLVEFQAPMNWESLDREALKMMDKALR